MTISEIFPFTNLLDLIYRGELFVSNIKPLILWSISQQAPPGTDGSSEAIHQANCVGNLLSNVQWNSSTLMCLIFFYMQLYSCSGKRNAFYLLAFYF